MLKEYDKAWAKYQERLSLLPLPLTTWEFYNLPRSEQKEFNHVQEKWVQKINYLEITKKKKVTILITDANFKIVFVSSNFVKMTGYDVKEVIGQSPKMFQGKATSIQTRKKIRMAIEKRIPFQESILNYKKDGTTYLCKIEAFPKFDKNGNFINYIAFESAA
ncbi:PAS domain-containing protein [Flavobacterium sp. J27]|uniref:PAS domain-containing protein n=1 Tax=Flavobacterium sp. J27 TaxID=2060419 RepID=UPI00102FD9A5|nr:PAS domain-containing protein [Flavobacterium sp. J27]